MRTPRNLCHWGSQQRCYHSPQLLQWRSPVNPTVFINVDSEDSCHLSHWGNQQPLQLQALRGRHWPHPWTPHPKKEPRLDFSGPWAHCPIQPSTCRGPWATLLFGTLVLGQFSLCLHSRFWLRSCLAHSHIQSPGPLSVQTNLYPGLQDYELCTCLHPRPQVQPPWSAHIKDT